jgi:hypothetical protein
MAALAWLAVDPCLGQCEDSVPGPPAAKPATVESPVFLADALTCPPDILSSIRGEGRGEGARFMERRPGYEVSDENGKVLSLFSNAAYRAEFRYLRRAFHKTDLAGSAVVTDGWTKNIPEAEWPFMGFCYFGYACAALAKNDPSLREEALAEMRWLIDALQTPRMSGFITPHLGEPFSGTRINASAFVHGHFLNLAVRYREVSGDSRYDELIHRVAAALTDAYSKTDHGILKSYKDMWWTSDNFPALSALSRYDRIFGRTLAEVRDRFLNSLKAHYLDANTGMYCTYIDPISRRQLQGPRGISQMYGLHFLKDFDADFATQQYLLARKHLFRPVLGLLAVREFPEGVKETPDVDSGPVLFGLGPSASGFAIAAAAINGDGAAAWQLAKASAMVGAPIFKNDELRYALMPPVGQAVILFGKTSLVKSPD